MSAWVAQAQTEVVKIRFAPSGAVGQQNPCVLHSPVPAMKLAPFALSLFCLLASHGAQAAGAGQTPGRPAGAAETFSGVPNGVYTALYRSGMKITRPGAYADGYPPGAFAVIYLDQTDPASIDGLRGNRLDSYVVLQDFSNKPWRVEFDRPIKAFRINVGDAPGIDGEKVWLKAWDNNRLLVTETQVVTDKDATVATTLAVESINPIYAVTFGSEGRSIYAGTALWDNIAIEYYY
jgi:hypothetical protein